ncbi:Translation initiation factor 2 [Minicystis rosea]|nr:Translation initiation factor 2 [Minicystis rosea]
MSLAPVEKASPVPAPSGGVHFAAAAEHASLCAELRARRYLVAVVPAAERGRLRQVIDEAVEGALAMRGALPPAVHLDAALEPTIRDQVFRARALGATGLCVTLGGIAKTADSGALEGADSETLLAWLAAAKRAPLLLVLDEIDRNARVLAPVPVADLAGPSPLAAAASDSTPPPASGEVESPNVEVRTPPPPVIAMPRRGVMKKRSAMRAEAAAPVEPVETERSVTPSAVVVAQKAAALMPPVPPIEPAPAVQVAPPVIEEEEPEPPTTPRPPLVVEASPARYYETPEPPRVIAPVEVPRATEPPPAPVARRVVDAAEWRTHAIELDKARGPKPVAVIEKLFGTRYAPLVGAVARGEADAAVRGVVDAWRTSFEHSWREAFSALRVTGKRPPMVFDAPDVAARIGRLNGARAVKLLLVDAMRFDIGERVAERLKDRLAGKAVCVERMLLWSAPPTTTPTQMALLGRGADGLRDAEPASEPDTEIVRGRAVSTLRRERAGTREVMKLDLVEARLRGSGPAYDDRLDAIADEVAPILIKFIETLPPRTLLFLFGDHGFRLPASPDGRNTGPATQGGVSPEEVLVPGQAWLVGGVH